MSGTTDQPPPQGLDIATALRQLQALQAQVVGGTGAAPNVQLPQVQAQPGGNYGPPTSLLGRLGEAVGGSAAGIIPMTSAQRDAMGRRSLIDFFAGMGSQPFGGLGPAVSAGIGRAELAAQQPLLQTEELNKLAQQQQAVQLERIRAATELLNSQIQLGRLGMLAGQPNPLAPGGPPGGGPGGGAPGTYVGTIDAHEGTGQNPNSSAFGIGQFLEGTWMNYAKAHPEMFPGLNVNAAGDRAAILAKRADPNIAGPAINWLAGENAKTLQANGVTPSGPSLGIAHYVGAGPAAKIMQAPDTAPVAGFVGDAAVKANPELGSMTVGQMKQRYAGMPNPGFLGGGGPSGAPSGYIPAITATVPPAVRPYQIAGPPVAPPSGGAGGPPAAPPAVAPPGGGGALPVPPVPPAGLSPNLSQGTPIPAGKLLPPAPAPGAAPGATPPTPAAPTPGATPPGPAPPDNRPNEQLSRTEYITKYLLQPTADEMAPGKGITVSPPQAAYARAQQALEAAQRDKAAAALAFSNAAVSSDPAAAQAQATRQANAADAAAAAARKELTDLEMQSARESGTNLQTWLNKRREELGLSYDKMMEPINAIKVEQAKAGTASEAKVMDSLNETFETARTATDQIDLARALSRSAGDPTFWQQVQESHPGLVRWIANLGGLSDQQMAQLGLAGATDAAMNKLISMARTGSGFQRMTNLDVQILSSQAPASVDPQAWREAKLAYLQSYMSHQMDYVSAVRSLRADGVPLYEAQKRAATDQTPLVPQMDAATAADPALRQKWAQQLPPNTFFRAPDGQLLIWPPPSAQTQPQARQAPPQSALVPVQ